MSFPPHQPNKLQRAPPDPRLARPQVSTQFPDNQGFHKPLPGIPHPGSLPPAIAAQHGVFVPPPPLVGHDFPPRAYAHGYDNNSVPTTPTSQHTGSAGSRPPSRPMTPTMTAVYPGQNPSMVDLTPPSTGRDAKAKRKSWFGRSKDAKWDERGPAAWVIGHDEKIPYNLSNLTGGHPVSEIWDTMGNCLVHLYPDSRGKEPTFRVDSSVFASSAFFARKLSGDLQNSPTTPTGDRNAIRYGGRRSLEGQTAALSMQTPPATPQRSSREHTQSDGELHLYIDIQFNGRPAPQPAKKSLENPISEDAQTLVDIRNLFAFLTGQSLVATERRPTFFSIFMRISALLKLYEFSNIDSSTYGEVALMSFDNYSEELGLADVRYSRQKTVESMVLAEQMRSISLYNEAFTHCVGKHDEIVKLNSELFQQLSAVTVNRLGRAAMDLEKRTASVQHILEDFDFPSIFAGMFNSKTADERKLVKFDAWKDSFFSTRKFLMGYYKQRFGSWPPKASSKKNELETSGLNRLVLRELYHDLSALYDLIVDRESLTNRTADGVLIDERDADVPVVRALRHILSEYDRSSPPVKPPIPFDLPTMPTLKSTRPEFGTGDTKKDTKALSKKLKDDEIAKVLQASYNRDATLPPFVQAFRDFSTKAAHSSNIQEIRDQRVGQWIFMYAVLQALPLLAIDAPSLKYSSGVEYFLCEPPRGGVPWAREDAARNKRNWYGIAGGGGVVSLPSDVIEHSIDGVYRRSHCWRMAQRWSAGDPALSAAVKEQGAYASSTPPTQQNGPGPHIGFAKPNSGAVHRQDYAMGTGMGTGNMLTPPPRLPRARVDSRSSSPSRHPEKRLSSALFNMEALPIPAGVQPEMPASRSSSSRPASRHEVDASKTFEAILGGDQLKGKKKR